MYGLSVTPEENAKESCSVTVPFTKNRFASGMGCLFCSFKLYS